MNKIANTKKPLLWSTVLLMIALIAGCGGGGGGGIALSTSAPTVTSTVPVDGSTGAAINANLTATFSEAMDPATISTTTFTLQQGGTPVTGVVSYTGTTATFNPTDNLLASTLYTATLTTGAKDLAGDALAENKVWTFTTGAAVDNTAPTVISTVPANTASSVALNASVIAIFSEAMDPATISDATFTLQQGGTPVTGVVTYTGTTATFKSSSNLLASTLYTATVTTGAKDLAANALAANKVWTFTTGAAVDNTAPTVTSTVPADTAVDVALNTNVTATFSEVMDPATISTTTFTLKQGTTPITGAVSYTGTTATFNPTDNLLAGVVYTATVTTGAKDLADNALAADKVWTFTTSGASLIAAGPDPVILGTAGNFVILSKSGVTTTGVTAVTGDLGVSPIDSTAITGFSLVADASNTFSTSTLVTGKIYAADYAPPTPAYMTTAISDMEIAYTDTAGRSSPDFTELGAGDISGLTLAPGLYKWGTGVSINTNVTLSGGPNDVWIFQISGDLTQASATSVVLAGGALPKNIFWQVAGGTGVTIGTTAQMKGVILAAKAITLNSGATIDGRVLAQTAITLIGNTVTQPAP